MKAVLVSCFNYYDQRLIYVEEYLKENNYEVIYICSDFDHIKKKKFIQANENTIQIKTKEYKKNLSLSRIFSHYLFSKKMYKEIEKLEPDLIYTMFPPNFVAFYVSRYKIKSPTTKLVFDIYDLWPESFPIDKIKKKIPIIFNIWGELRNTALKSADYVFTECELYQKMLKVELSTIKTSVLHLTKNKGINVKFEIEQDYFDICYLGSINNIIDIQLIDELLVEINKKIKVRLHIIGDGEKKDEFINKITKSEIEVIYYGKIFDEIKKKEIMSRCRFGLNIMKKSVSVGLTMKSVDYIEGRLPIINNIKADTEEIVNKYNIGYNIDLNGSKYLSEILTELTIPEIITMKNNTDKVFKLYFSTDAFKKQLGNMFTQ